MNSTHSIAGSKLYYRICGCILFFVAAAASFHGYWEKYKLLESGTVNPELRQTFEAMIDGTAPRPFVDRQLLPAIANFIGPKIEAALPTHAKEWLYRGHASKPTGEMLLDSPIINEPQYLVRYCLVYGMVFLFTWLAVYLMYALCREVGYHPAASALAAIAMILVMPYFLTGGGYFYDYPELAFMLLVVWVALKFNWWWMVPVVALAAWNKESFLLFIPALYPLLRRRVSRPNAFIAIAVLGSTCAAVYYALRTRYANNPGGSVEIHIAQQLHFFTHFDGFSSLEKTYGLLYPRGLYIGAVALIAWTAWRGWRLLPAAFQRHAQIAASINVLFYLLFCAPGELRDLSMLYVTLILLLAANLSDWIDKTPPTVHATT